MPSVSEGSLTRKAAFCQIPLTGYSGKGQMAEIENRSVVARGWGGGGSRPRARGTGVLWGGGMNLHGPGMVGTTLPFCQNLYSFTAVGGSLHV